MRVERRLIGIVVSAFAIALVAVGPAGSTQPDKTTLPVRGMVRPLNQAAIATDLQTRVDAVHFKEGDAFKQGDVLIAFDCERQRAELAAVTAQHREMKLALDSASYLDKKRAVGRFEVEVSRARTEKAAADVAALQARIKQCVIVAPYDGRVSELLINAHETPTPGKPIISVVDETAFEIDLIVPSHWLRKLAVGASFKFSVDELGTMHSGKLVRIGAAIDAVSQSVKVIGKFDARPERVLSGMSGNALFAEQGS